MKQSVTAEVCRQYCEASHKLTQENGIYTAKQMPKLASFTAIMAVMRQRGLVEMPRKGKYKWVGPDDITIVTGEALYRAYRKYEDNRNAAKAPKTNGAAAKPRPEKPSRLQQIEARLAALEDAESSVNLAHRVQQLEHAVAEILAELS